MKSVFADTSHFIALLNAKDEAHARAVQFLAAYDGLIVTTSWVLAELGAFMSQPPARALCLKLFEQLAREPMVEVVPADQQQFNAGLLLFADRLDKCWSLTDCISFDLMNARGITDALSADHHFEQAGFRALLRNCL
jgi:predicted nucleic acid-binding protein